GEPAAPAGVDRDVLLAVDLVGDRCGDRDLLDRHFPDLLAGVRAVGDEGGADGALEHEVAGGDEHTATALLLDRAAPDFALGHRVPRREPAFRVRVGVLGDR